MRLALTAAPPLMASAPAVHLEVEMPVAVIAQHAVPARGNLPGPSRRIVVEPIEAPVEPVQVPGKSPVEPARRPEDEPAVPAR
jgi:hypothetical protein